MRGGTRYAVRHLEVVRMTLRHLADLEKTYGYRRPADDSVDCTKLQEVTLQRLLHQNVAWPPALVLSRAPVVGHARDDPGIVVVVPGRQQRPRLMWLEDVEKIERARRVRGSDLPRELHTADRSVRDGSLPTLGDGEVTARVPGKRTRKVVDGDVVDETPQPVAD